jgi:hypothetical protein
MDMGNAVWTVPADRMKAGREHRVPLTEPAPAILREMAVARKAAWTLNTPLIPISGGDSDRYKVATGGNSPFSAVFVSLPEICTATGKFGLKVAENLGLQRCNG